MQLKRKKIEKWVDLEDGSALLLSPLMPSEASAITERHTRRKIKRGVEVVRIDSGAVARDTFAAVVKDWRGMKDEDGKELPFSIEVLSEVVDSDSDFIRIVNEKIEELSEEARRGDASAEKN